MKRIDVVQSIRSLKGTNHTANPDSEWVAASRSRLLQHIDRTTEEIPTRVFSLVHLWSALSLILPQRTVYAVVRPAFIFVICFSLGTAGWITTVSASLESLPGDTLYAVKIATEHTQVAVVEAMKGNAASTELRLSFVTRRVDEVSKVIASASSNEKEHKVRVDQAVENLKTEVQTVSVQLQEVKQNNPEAAVHVAQLIDRKVDAIQQSLETTGVTASSTGAVIAIAQLKLETDSIRVDAASSTASSTPVVAAKDTATSTPAITTTTITIVVPPQTTSTVIIVEQQRPAPPLEQPAPVETKLDSFPERPLELAPDVVDTATPIGIQLLN